MALLPDLAWAASIPLGATLLLLLYPTGRPPSPRWRPVVGAVVVATMLAVVASALTPGPTDYLPVSTIPWGWSGPDGRSTFSSRSRSW